MNPVNEKIFNSNFLVQRFLDLSVAINSIYNKNQHSSNTEIKTGHDHQKEAKDQWKLSAKRKNSVAFHKGSFLKIFVHT